MDETISLDEPTAVSPTRARGIGALMIVIGLLLAKLCVYDVVHAALAGAPEVSTSNGAVLAPAAVLLGGLALFGGPGALRWIQSLRGKPAGGVLALLMAGMGLALRFGLESWLATQGYG